MPPSLLAHRTRNKAHLLHALVVIYLHVLVRHVASSSANIQHCSTSPSGTDAVGAFVWSSRHRRVREASLRDHKPSNACEPIMLVRLRLGITVGPPVSPNKRQQCGASHHTVRGSVCQRNQPSHRHALRAKMAFHRVWRCQIGMAKNGMAKPSLLQKQYASQRYTLACSPRAAPRTSPITFM